MKQFESTVEEPSGVSLAAQNTEDPDAGAICRGCDLLPAPVKITCRDGRVQIERPAVTLVAGMEIRWTGLLDDHEVPWKVTFHKSPAVNDVKVFDQDHPECVIANGCAGSYTYTAHVQDCRHAAQGNIEVILPDRQ